MTKKLIGMVALVIGASLTIDGGFSTLRIEI